MVTTLEDFMKIATKEQKDLLIKIGEAAEQEKKSSDEVNRIHNSIKTGIYSSDGGLSVTVCEDEDDAMVISAGPRQKVGDAKKHLKEYMVEAVKLGMGHLGFIQRNYEHYVGEPLPKK
jgi:hypothetical protein